MPTAADLTLLLIVAIVTPTLTQEIQVMNWTLVDLGGGYRQILGAVYDCYVAVVDEVAETERDEFLRIFSHQPVTDPVANWWLRDWLDKGTMKRQKKDIPGYDEMYRKLLEGVPVEMRLAGLSPEERLAGLKPEERLAGLGPNQLVLALPDDILGALDPRALARLPVSVQEKIRLRLDR